MYMEVSSPAQVDKKQCLSQRVILRIKIEITHEKELSSVIAFGMFSTKAIIINAIVFGKLFNLSEH